MESHDGLGGSYAQEFRSLGEILGKKRKFCGGHLEFCNFGIENIMFGMEIFSMDSLTFNTKIMSMISSHRDNDQIRFSIIRWRPF